jgi:CubicO group peptidase (beta-lactamase class C family)
MTPAAPIEGNVAAPFAAVRTVFAENFRRDGDYREVGAALTVFHNGRCVVDLWGGFVNRVCSQPWLPNSLVNVWSGTKGVVAVAIAQLVDRGLLRYEDRLADLWPEFGQGGKREVTVAHVMSHQAGLPGFTEPTTMYDQFDWQRCCERLARQEPQFPPGTATSYHALTFGWLAGEVIRRVTGKSVGTYVREEIAAPLRADIHVGLPAAEEPRVAETIGPRRLIDVHTLSLPEPARMALSNPAQDPESPNLRDWRAAEIPAANGHASARGLGRLYAALAEGGTLNGARILSPEAVTRLSQPVTQSGRIDQLLGFADCWGMGVVLNRMGVYGPNPDTFGHSGWGGSFGCADPGARIAIGYVCNQMGPELVGDARTLGLCQAVYNSIGRTS